MGPILLSMSGFLSIVKHEFLLRSEIVNLSGQALNPELVELEHYRVFDSNRD